MNNELTIIIVDFEATCDENERLVPRNRMEIIEIGAVKVRLSDFKNIDEFQSLIKPVRTPQLTEFCKKLTGIQQHEINAAKSFYEVASDFFEWCWKDTNVVAWCSWAMYDYYQLEQDCEHFYVDNELLCIEHINLKNLYGDVSFGRRRGLKNALTEQGLKFEGRNHRGLDDARNSLAIIKHMPNFKQEILNKLREVI
ncbi:TPA: exonuclease domain-containing protein [Photobacterium damselae]